MMKEMIQQNFMAVTIIIFLMLFILLNNNFDKKTNRLFLCSAVCVLLFIVEEAWEGQLARRDTYSYMRVVLSAAGYTLRPMTAYFLVMINGRKNLKWTLLMSIPAVLNMLVAFSALFGSWSFGYTQLNEFVRGPLGYAPFVTAGFYVAAVLLMTMWKCKKGDLMEAMTVSMIVILIIFSTVMESVFHFRSIQSAASGISITFYYLFLHTNQSNRDPLTSALTRRRFYLDAERYRTALTAVISLDLNNLKVLNDKYGHVAGDKALVTMTEVVKKCITKKASLYRTGGDEFMILCYKLSEQQVQEMIKQIQEAMEETEYRCAIGYATYHYRVGLDHACQLADDAMYENKQEMKCYK